MEENINKSTLLGKFETAYDEFKRYSNFYLPYVDEAREKIKNTVQFVMENIDDVEKITDHYTEYNSRAHSYALDMNTLKERLVTVYETVEDLVELPQEIKEEMKDIIKMKSQLLFKIEAGKPIPINPEYDSIVKAKIKESGVIEQMVKQIKSTNNA